VQEVVVNLLRLHGALKEVLFITRLLLIYLRPVTQLVTMH
jgi:hypothetical protein